MDDHGGDLDHRTPLHMSIIKRQHGHLEQLLTDGADPRKQTKEISDTGLHLAAWLGDLRSIHMLLKDKRGRECLLKKNQHGYTPYEVANNNRRFDAKCRLKEEG